MYLYIHVSMQENVQLANGTCMYACVHAVVCVNARGLSRALVITMRRMLAKEPEGQIWPSVMFFLW